MTADAQPVRQDDVERASGIARDHAHAGAMAALAYDLLSRQAEGRTLLSGRELVATRATEHGVDRDAAATDAGNLVAILERGAQSPIERALIAAFAVRGLGAKLAGESAQDASQRVFRWVRQADWLEVATPYAVHPFVDAVLDTAQATLIYDELAQAVVDDAAGRDGARPEVRAHNAARFQREARTAIAQ